MAKVITTEQKAKPRASDKVRAALRAARWVHSADLITLVATVEFGVIILLLWALTSEFQANQYMQRWISENASPLVFLLNGYVVALLVGVLIGLSILLLRRIGT